MSIIFNQATNIGAINTAFLEKAVCYLDSNPQARLMIETEGTLENPETVIVVFDGSQPIDSQEYRELKLAEISQLSQRAFEQHKVGFDKVYRHIERRYQSVANTTGYASLWAQSWLSSASALQLADNTTVYNFLNHPQIKQEVTILEQNKQACRQKLKDVTERQNRPEYSQGLALSFLPPFQQDIEEAKTHAVSPSLIVDQTRPGIAFTFIKNKQASKDKGENLLPKEQRIETVLKEIAEFTGPTDLKRWGPVVQCLITQTLPNTALLALIVEVGGYIQEDIPTLIEDGSEVRFNLKANGTETTIEAQLDEQTDSIKALKVTCQANAFLHRSKGGDIKPEDKFEEVQSTLSFVLTLDAQDKPQVSDFKLTHELKSINAV